MRWTLWMLTAAFLIVAAGGCGGPKGTAPDSGPNTADSAVGGSQSAGVPPSAAAAGSAAIASSDTSQPAAAVAVFLDALRRGDDDKILEMYTVRAREQTTQLNEHFAPRGSDTARFTVGKVEQLSEEHARVASTWTDLDQDGESHTMEFQWRLRREPEGWRVAGMEVDPPPPLEERIVLDFENLEETIRRVNALAERLQQQAQTEAGQAEAAKNSGGSLR
jgi:hypothetical protein